MAETAQSLLILESPETAEIFFDLSETAKDCPISFDLTRLPRRKARVMSFSESLQHAMLNIAI